MYSVSRSLQRSVINPARLNQQMAMIYALNYVKICFAILVRLYLPLLNREFDRTTYSPRYHKHLKRLTAWATFSAQPSSVESTGGHDLCEDLLRNSRARLPTITQPSAATTEADDEAAMLAEFEANFS